MSEKESRDIGRKDCQENAGIRVRLFGLRNPKSSGFEEESFPYSPALTVADVWRELRMTAEPGTPLANLTEDVVLALLNGTPIQRLAGWDTRLSEGDTITFMVKAFGG